MNNRYQELILTTIYQVYVRNHTVEGTFKALIKDLDRIKDLGIKIIYLLPINPIGEEHRKGELGSPYAISDYRAINHELGTIDDFIMLINEVHKRDMKLMIDIVFHHTSYGSILSIKHPEWFIKKADGSFGNKVGDWWDIIDFDFSKEALHDELIDILLSYAKLGVDAFRCDVAPLIPLSFWIKAKKELLTVNPNFIMLSESVDPGFIVYLRSLGYTAHSDGEMYQAFDILYDYDAYYKLNEYLKGKCPLEDYIEKIRMQEYIYPASYLKIHFLENHDQVRIASLAQGSKLLNLTAFSLFAKGVGFIYAGQEVGNDHLPDLFNKDTIDFKTSNFDLCNLIKKLIQLKGAGLYNHTSQFTILKNNIHKDLILAYYIKGSEVVVGIFNLSSLECEINLDELVKDGSYINLVNEENIMVKNAMIKVKQKPLIFIAK